MAAKFLLQKLLIGAFVDFIPHGSTVDAETTSPLVQPDDDPIANWTEFNLGCITQAVPGTETQDDPDLCPTDDGHYRRISDIKVISDYWDITLKNHNDLIFQLLLGLKQGLTGVTGQEPYENTGDRKIVGWARMRARAGTTTDKILMKFECVMRIQNYEGFRGESATRPVVRLEVLSNGLNDIIDDEITV